MVAVGEQAGPNYEASTAMINVWKHGNFITTLRPEKRRYIASGQVMTEAAIDASMSRDLYVALGERLGKDAWAVRLQYKPMVRFIWLGSLLIGLGAIVTALDRRYRTQARPLASETSGSAQVVS